MSDFDLEDFRTYADRHRGRNVRSGPHWPLVMRYPVLFDAYEKTLARAEKAERERDELKTENATLYENLIGLSDALKTAERKMTELCSKLTRAATAMPGRVPLGAVNFLPDGQVVVPLNMTIEAEQSSLVPTTMSDQKEA